MATDQLYLDQELASQPFRFDERVTHVFDDMILRSIPGYQDIVTGVANISTRYVVEDSQIYDLGCSSGNVSLAIARANKDKACQITAVDLSQPMVKRCTSRVEQFQYRPKIEVLQADITEMSYQPCHFVSLNFTLQFLCQSQRLPLLRRIYNALSPGSVLVISEKIVHRCAVGEDWLVEHHHDFKRVQGYSDLEISGKRTALENVMILDSLATHEARLRAAGFRDSVIWYKHLNFCSMVAFK